MIRYIRGDLLASETEALVNAVNCVGVMGKGIALQFKRAYPDVFAKYKAACAQGEVVPGSMFVVEIEEVYGKRCIIHFPTKRHFQERSRIEDIDTGLIALRSTLLERGLRSVAVPALGCGLGGLDWKDVRRRIESSLGDLRGVEVLVYEP